MLIFVKLATIAVIFSMVTGHIEHYSDLPCVRCSSVNPVPVPGMDNTMDEELALGKSEEF